MTTDDILALYQAIANATADMRAAALAHEWDRLAPLSSQVAKSLAALQAGGAEPLMTAEEIHSKVALIKQILADEQAVKEASLARKAVLTTLITGTAQTIEQVASGHA